MSGKEKAVDRLYGAGLPYAASREAIDAILAAVREDLGMLPKGATGSTAMGVACVDGYHGWVPTDAAGSDVLGSTQRHCDDCGANGCPECTINGLEFELKAAYDRAEKAEARVRELEKECDDAAKLIKTIPGMRDHVARLDHDLAAANKRIAELEEIVKESAARKPVWDKLDAMAEKLVSIGEHTNTSPKPAATEGDWAEKRVESMLEYVPECYRNGLRMMLVPWAHRIASEAERRGEVKGLRWAQKAAESPNAYVSIRAEADRIEREGKGAK